MRSVLLVLLLLLLIAAGGAFVMLGALPPAPHQTTIQKVLPNDRFGHGS